MKRGYVKLWRKSLDNDLIRHSQAWQLMTWALLKAAHNKREIIVGSTIMELEPGQLVFSRISLAHELNTTERKIRTALDILKKCKFLTVQATSKFSIITIIKWDIYQAQKISDDQQIEQEATSRRPADAQQTATKKELIELSTNKKEKNYGTSDSF